MKVDNLSDEFVLGENGERVATVDWINIPDRPFIQGQTPRIEIIGQTLPEVWERSVLANWFYGGLAATQYDKPDEPPSRDCTIELTILEPLTEPRIHKCFPGAFEDLEIYRQEVVIGIHDHWIDLTPGSTKWPYTYHDRLFNYNPRYPEPGPGIDQIDQIIRTLAETPYSRRANAVTWYPWFDPQRTDPPCLQRVWCRLIPNENGQLVLNMNFSMRSWDAYKAALMNIFAFIDLEELIAREIAKLRNEEILVGPLSGYGDSFHIYGKDFQNPELVLSFQGFLHALRIRPWVERVCRLDNPIVQECFEEARERIKKEQ